MTGCKVEEHIYKTHFTHTALSQKRFSSTYHRHSKLGNQEDSYLYLICQQDIQRTQACWFWKELEEKHSSQSISVSPIIFFWSCTKAVQWVIHSFLMFNLYSYVKPGCLTLFVCSMVFLPSSLSLTCSPLNQAPLGSLLLCVASVLWHTSWWKHETLLTHSQLLLSPFAQLNRKAR